MVATPRIRWGNLDNIIDELHTDLPNKQLRHLEPLAIWRPSVWSCLHSSLFSSGICKHLSSFLSLRYLFLQCHLTFDIYWKLNYMPGTIYSRTFIFLILLKSLEVRIIISCSQIKKIRLKGVVLQHNNKRSVFEPIPFSIVKSL